MKRIYTSHFVCGCDYRRKGSIFKLLIMMALPSESSTSEWPIPLVSEEAATAVVATVFVSQLL